MTKWINCKDQAPPEDRPILVWDGSYAVGGSVIYNNETGNLLEGGPAWDFTYWAEQPEPPVEP